jgi:hypothetical protein
MSSSRVTIDGFYYYIVDFVPYLQPNLTMEFEEFTHSRAALLKSLSASEPGRPFVTHKSVELRALVFHLRRNLICKLQNLLYLSRKQLGILFITVLE